jgi:cell division initiation protein
MLTIDEIKEISFRRAGKNGYNAADVDEFIDDVVALVEQQNAERSDLIRKLDILAKKIEEYRRDEETVRNALITSQKLSDSTIKEAQTKADYIVKTAEKKSRAILTEAEMATEREKDKFESLHAETAKLRREIIALYKKHLAVVEEMPTEEEVEAKRKELDEKYPFEPVEEVISADVDVEEEMVQTAEPAPAPADDEDVIVRTPVNRQGKHGSDAKFNSLQFGDNYDVE